jgi:hypothetical protein
LQLRLRAGETQWAEKLGKPLWAVRILPRLEQEKNLKDVGIDVMQQLTMGILQPFYLPS